MALQYSSSHRSDSMTDLVTLLGATSYLLLYTGSVPASCATAASGTLLGSLPCSATFGTVASGVLTANAITTVTASGTGTAGYWRLATSSAGTTVIVQGITYGTSTLSTNASTSTGNILPFAATSPIVVGQTVTGTSIPAFTYVLGVSGSTITLNNNITATIGSAATITFGGDLTFTGGVAFTSGMQIAVTSFVLTANGA